MSLELRYSVISSAPLSFGIVGPRLRIRPAARCTERPSDIVGWPTTLCNTGVPRGLAVARCENEETSADEAKFGAAVELFARPQHRRRKIRVMRRVGEVLRL